MLEFPVNMSMNKKVRRKGKKKKKILFKINFNKPPL